MPTLRTGMTAVLAVSALMAADPILQRAGAWQSGLTRGPSPSFGGAQSVESDYQARAEPETDSPSPGPTDPNAPAY